jgi:hypothetical protein
MRARVSSPRFVSWVAVASNEWGQRAARSVLAAWNASTDTPKRPGLPPTSLSETSRWWR